MTAAAINAATADKQTLAAIAAVLPYDPADALRVLMQTVAVVGFAGGMDEERLYAELRDGLNHFDAHAKVRAN